MEDTAEADPQPVVHVESDEQTPEAVALDVLRELHNVIRPWESYQAAELSAQEEALRATAAGYLRDYLIECKRQWGADDGTP